MTHRQREADRDLRAASGCAERWCVDTVHAGQRIIATLTTCFHPRAAAPRAQSTMHGETAVRNTAVCWLFVCVFLSLSLPVCVSASQFLSACFSLFYPQYLSLALPQRPSVSQPRSPSVSLSVPASVYLSLSASLSLIVPQCLSLIVPQPRCPSVFQPHCPLVAQLHRFSLIVSASSF